MCLYVLRICENFKMRHCLNTRNFVQQKIIILEDKLKNEDDSKNYETYNNERKEQVFASSNKFQIKRFR